MSESFEVAEPLPVEQFEIKGRPATLVWFTRNGRQALWLDPDHPHHQTNMNQLSIMERKVLLVFLETVADTVRRADQELHQ